MSYNDETTQAVAAAMRAERVLRSTGGIAKPMTSADYPNAMRWEQGAYDMWNTNVLALASAIYPRRCDAIKRDAFRKACGVGE